MTEFVLSGQELFGRYARIAYGHALDGKQNYHIYKCIKSFMSNCYCDVPLTYQTENNCHTHDNIVEVVNVIHCGIDENRVIRVARNDIELLPAADVAPVRWQPVLGYEGLYEVNQFGQIRNKDGQIMRQRLKKAKYGVTVQELDGCEYCKEDSEGFRRMFGAFSLVNPFHGKTWQIHAGKCKPMEINFCPMCGRRLPQPPKVE